MELIPILTRAESLFRRFERVVQAVDKKNNFPTPSTLSISSSSSSETGPRLGGQKGKSPSSQSTTDPAGVDKKVKVISPELRRLLSRENVTVSMTENAGVTGSNTVTR